MKITDLKANANSVIIERIDEDEKTESGIIVSTAVSNKDRRDPIAKGLVHSVGPCSDQFGNNYDPGVKAGDTVIYRRNAFLIEIPHDTKNYFSVPIGRVEMVLE